MRSVSNSNCYLFFFPNHSSNTSVLEVRGSFFVSVEIGKIGALFSVSYVLSFHELTCMCKHAQWKQEVVVEMRTLC